jgi:hypothetical protein
MDAKEDLLAQLNETVYQLLDLFQNMTDPTLIVYELWTAKDILGHLTFWHESFARNLSDLVNDVKPTLLKGRFIDLNQSGVDEMRKYSLTVVLQRFATAHRVIQENINNPKLILIPYKKGSRDYSPQEHLDIVNEHIKEHFEDIISAVAKKTKTEVIL